MMAHLDDESLVLLAMGDAVPDASQREHLLTCSRCAAEVASLNRLVSIGRTSRDVEIVRPPARVWTGIHTELGLSDELADVPSEQGATAAAPVTPMRRGHHAAARWWLVAAALVIGLGVGAVGSSFLSQSESPKVLAEARLRPFPDWSASGVARVEQSTAGSREVVVDLSAPSGGLREVWLIDPDTSGLVSLGLLSGTSGTFSIPADLDLSRYSVVDVSEEPDDGDPSHSGNSIVRGALSNV